MLLLIWQKGLVTTAPRGGSRPAAQLLLDMRRAGRLQPGGRGGGGRVGGVSVVLAQVPQVAGQWTRLSTPLHIRILQEK